MHIITPYELAPGWLVECPAAGQVGVQYSGGALVITNNTGSTYSIGFSYMGLALQ